MTDRPCRRRTQPCGCPTNRKDRLCAAFVWGAAFAFAAALGRLTGLVAVTGAAVAFVVLCTAVLLLRGHRAGCATTRGARALVRVTDGF
ncbi:hypothetical protein ACFU5O_00310 [Streptomyces sp. NPDC057445]|uniref:hypothetical protein n=1 Tax=Streptomyces sp. NPDC057445 TaxID=3346136 RepID=UPI0036A7340C